MPFDFDETSPSDASAVSSFPANERNSRAAVHDAFEIDHEEATGEHKKVTLQEQGSDPTNAADKGHVYTKDVSGVTELFYRASNGDIYQLTIGGLGPNDALLRASGASAAQRTMAAALILANTIGLQANESGGTARDVAKMTAGDVIQLGNTTTVTLEVLVNALSGLIARHASGTARILTVDDEGAGNGLDADLLGGLSHLNFLGITGTKTSREYAFVETTSMNTQAVAHGLSGVPNLLICYMECLTVDRSYAVGDRLAFSSDSAGSNQHATSVSVDATNLRVSADPTLRVANKGTSSSGAINPGRWKLGAHLWYWGT